MRTTAIGFLGTGIMGAPMARHLATAGHTVAVWNRSMAKTEPLAAQGCAIAGTPDAAVVGADVVITMLSDARATGEVIAAAAPGLSPGQVWIQMGTVGDQGCDELAALADRHGLVFVDAPVLGSRDAAEAGTLLVLAAGPDTQVERTTTLLEPISREVRWLGAAGTASRTKLVANSWVVGLTALLGETVGLADGLGVDPAQFLATIRGGPLDSGYAQVKGEMMLTGRYDTQFPVQHAGKDARLCVEAAAAHGIDLRVLAAVAAQYAEAGRRGHGAEDMAAVREAARPEPPDVIDP